MATERYELRDGTTTKFWELTLSGTKYAQRWGKDGGSVSSNEKAFATAAQARVAADKAIAKKVAEGFAKVGAGNAKKGKTATAEPTPAKGKGQAAAKAKPTKAKQDNAIEAMLAENPDDKGTWQVYADSLLEQGEPWGEVIVKACSGKQRKADLEVVAAELTGELDNASLRWMYGVLDTVELTPEENPEDAAGEQRYYETLARILRHPAGRMVRTIRLGLPPLVPGDIHWSMTPLVKVIGECGPLPLLAELDMTHDADHMDQESWRAVGDLRPLWKAAPRLRRLLVKGSHGSGSGETPIKLGAIEAPHLQEFTYISSGLDKSCPVDLGKAALPALTTLNLYFGDENYGNTCTIKSLAGILEGSGLPKLTHLGLMNSKFEADLVKALAKSPLVKRLETLDLSMGIFYEDGPRALIEHAASFTHLESLDVSDNYITDELEQQLCQALPNVEIGDQRGLEEEDHPEYRYPSVGE